MKLSAIGAGWLAALVVCASAPARAAEGPFALGLVLGSPMGISARLALGPSFALDLGAGSGTIRDDGPEAHLGLLWTAAVAWRSPGFSMPLYLGIGSRLMDAEGRHQGEELHLGVRVPLGVAARLAPSQLEIFAEVAPVYDLVQHNGQALDLDFGVGVRYGF